MALTPEDVVNKRFQPTKFREGYDQDEVDDFLDEVVVELRRLGQENEDMRQRLIASEARIAELQRSNVPNTAEQAQQAPAQQLSYPTAQVDSGSVDPSNTNNLLQLARRLHEEHVRDGVEKRDALIAEGHAAAARVVSDAEAKQRSQMGSLDQERAMMEHRIDELRSFEREYRQKLKGYIEGQLRDLDSSTTVTAGSYSGVGMPAASGFQGFGAN